MDGRVSVYGKWTTWLMVLSCCVGFVLGAYNSPVRPVAAVEPRGNGALRTTHLSITDEDGRVVMTLSGSGRRPSIEFLGPDNTQSLTIGSGGQLSRGEMWVTFQKDQRPLLALTPTGLGYFNDNDRTSN